MLHFHNGILITPDALCPGWTLVADADRIHYVGPNPPPLTAQDQSIDLQGAYLAPGFIDLHVHGGAGSDFMDNTPHAWHTICRAHARHGTTSFTPTTTVASHEHHLRFLQLTRLFVRNPDPAGARVLGAHLYGPYFAKQAVGCHPSQDVRPPTPQDYEPFLEFADVISTATVAPELSGAMEFVAACRARGVRCNAGHSYATFAQMQASIAWGVRHVDHLFCAMSDRSRLKQTQPFPMRAGVMEATLFFDELTTEVIADGCHLDASLLRLAYKIKGSDRLALVTDTSRAMDMPDGPSLFGPLDAGQPILKRDGVGLMPDGLALASSVVGMDHCLRTFHRLVPEAGLPNVVKMATLTPAKILGVDSSLGSLHPGKSADLVILNPDLTVRQTYVAGLRMSCTPL